MAKVYIAKESTSQEILTTSQSVLTAVNNITSGGAGGSGSFEVELSGVTNFVATPGNQQVRLKWTDPENVTHDKITYSRWLGTKVVRKEASAPESLTDGTLVVDSTVKNAYATTPYTDSGLTDNTVYFYKCFPYFTTGTYADGESAEAKPSGKAPASMLLSANTAEIYVYGDIRLTEEITVTTNGDGEIVAFSDNPGVATVSVNGSTITIRGESVGTANIVVSQLESRDFVSPTDATVAVTVSGNVSRVLADNSFSTIKSMVKAGLASSLWDVGDTIPIMLNGDLKKADDTVGMTFNQHIYYATVLGFNHNTVAESNGKNSVHFILGKDRHSKTDIAFNGFPMNTTDVNTGGWEQSKMRTITCPSFYDCLPKDWQNVIGTVTKYSDNTGNGSSQTPTDTLTSTQDKIFLLSEFEVQGAKSYACASEGTYQEQYAYYKNGNSKTRYDATRTTATASGQAVNWWCRSTFASGAAGFCSAGAYYPASHATGFAPGFAIIAES